MAVETRTLAGRIPSAEVSAIRFAVGLVGCGVLFALRRRGPDLRQWRLLGLAGVVPWRRGLELLWGPTALADRTYPPDP